MLVTLLNWQTMRQYRCLSDTFCFGFRKHTKHLYSMQMKKRKFIYFFGGDWFRPCLGIQIFCNFSFIHNFQWPLLYIPIFCRDVSSFLTLHCSVGTVPQSIFIKKWIRPEKWHIHIHSHIIGTQEQLTVSVIKWFQICEFYFH